MEISSAIKLETQTSIESNNEINSEITKLTSLTNPNLQLESNDNKTPTPISFATNDTNASNFSSTSKSLSYKSHSGKIRKPGTNYVFKQENIKSYTDTHGIVYNVNGKMTIILVELISFNNFIYYLMNRSCLYGY